MNKKLQLSVIFLFLANLLTAQQWNGYTLYSQQNGSSAYLMDTSQTTYHSWTSLPVQTGYSCYLEPGGTIVRAAKGGTTPTGAPNGPICGKVQKHNYAGTLTWDFTYAGTDYITHHDICPMPNGNVLVICYERKTATEVSAAGASNSIQMWPDKIVEIQPTGATTGNVVWEWHTWDHLVQNIDSTKANFQSSIVNHPELININYKQTADWQHTNGLDYNPILDQIVFSCHNFSEWFIIDHSTTTAEAATHVGGNSGKGGDILYRWGNPASYSASGTQILNVTHDAHWIPEGCPNAGRLAGFNNQQMGALNSFADQIDVPINGYNYTITLGQAYTPTSYTDQITLNGFSSNMGSTQQLPNGNQLICIATAGKVYEINATGTQLWTKSFTGGAVPQARKYDLCYITNPAPAIPTISLSGTTLSSTSATTYQWYKNGVLIAGATNQTYSPTTSGIYVVRITDVNGCVFEYSKGYNYSVAPAGINEIDLSSSFDIFPNPTSGILSIKNNSSFTNYSISINDFFGKEIIKSANTNTIDLSNIANGIYLIKIITNNNSFTKKIIVNK